MHATCLDATEIVGKNNFKTLVYLLQSYHPWVTFLALKTLTLRAIHDLGEAC